MEKPQIISHIEKSLDFTLFDCKWIPRSARFVVLGSYPRGTGAILVYEISHREIKKINDKETPASMKCGTFAASSLQSRNLATGDFRGHLTVWDIETMQDVYSVPAHNQIINAIDGVGGLGVGEGAPEIVTGSRDGCVKVWDVRQKNVPVANMEPEEGQETRDCWTVAFGNAFNSEDRCVCAGYDNGDIKLFDLKTMSIRWETNLSNGVCAVEFDRKDIAMNKLVAASLEGKFQVFDLRTQHRTKGFASLTEKAHKSTVWLCKHLPQNRDVFVTTGGAGSLNLWKYEYPPKRCKTEDNEQVGVVGNVQLLQNAMLSTQPICGFDWSPDKLGLGVCTAFDQSLRVIITTKLNSL
ncbi:dynein axonemal assembly factor 10-like [Styela clava]|uniref:WD repeat-containing protein 92-like n=1 Tax=Styela clava TaxID=7725 RepID=UPI00193A3D59|nr:WD repeat-containing protein 92-like [Styela clava]